MNNLDFTQSFLQFLFKSYLIYSNSRNVLLFLKHAIKKAYFQISNEQSYIYAAIAAVVVVHVIVGAFIYVAWQDANAKVIKKKKQ